MTTEAPGITVLLLSIPERGAMLAEAMRSIEDQTLQPFDVLVDVAEPEPHRRPQAVAEARNRLLAQAKTEWVATFDDDDKYLPDHFAKVSATLGDFDVLHTHCDIYSSVDVADMAPEVLAHRLTQGNILTSNATIRTSVARSLGGWGGDFDESTGRFAASGTWSDDWDFWVRSARAGARFRLLPEITWEYRLHDGQASKQWAALKAFA